MLDLCTAPTPNANAWKASIVLEGPGPMRGRADVFTPFVPGKIPAAIERGPNETKRPDRMRDAQRGRGDLRAGGSGPADIASGAFRRMPAR